MNEWIDKLRRQKKTLQLFDYMYESDIMNTTDEQR